MSIIFSRIQRRKGIVEKKLSFGLGKKMRVKIPSRRLKKGPFKGQFPKFKMIFCWPHNFSMKKLEIWLPASKTTRILKYQSKNYFLAFFLAFWLSGSIFQKELIDIESDAMPMNTWLQIKEDQNCPLTKNYKWLRNGILLKFLVFQFFGTLKFVGLQVYCPL